MPTNVDTVIAELNPDHRKKVEVRAAQLMPCRLARTRASRSSSGRTGKVVQEAWFKW